MVRPLLHNEITRGVGPVVVVGEFREEGRPISGQSCVCKSRIRVEGNTEFPRVKSVDICCRFPNVGIAINDWSPKTIDKPGSSVTFVAGGSPIPVSLGITIPRASRIVEARLRSSSELFWRFLEIELDNSQATIEGAFPVTFDELGPFDVNMSVQPYFYNYRHLRLGKVYPPQQPTVEILVATLEPESEEVPVLRRKTKPRTTSAKQVPVASQGR